MLPLSTIEELSDPRAPLPRETARDMLSRMSDEEVREILLNRLDAETQRTSAGSGADIAAAISSIQDNLGIIRGNLRATLFAADDLPSEIGQAFEALRDGRPFSLMIMIVFAFGGMIVTGWLAELLYRRATRDVLSRFAAARPDSLLSRFGYLFMRLILDIFGLFAFLAGAVALFFVLHQGHELTRIAIMTYLGAIVATRLFAHLSLFAVAPNSPQHRLSALNDEDAAYAHRAFVIIGAIAAFGYSTCSLLATLGTGRDAVRLLKLVVSFTLVGVIVYANLRGGRIVTADIMGPRETAGRGRILVAELWPRINIAFTVLLLAMTLLINFSGGAVGYLAGLGSLATVLLYPHIDALLERPSRETGMFGVNVNEFRIVVLRAARIVLAVGALAFLGGAWGVDLFSLTQQGLGAQLTSALIQIGLTVLVAYVLWQFARITIDRKLAVEAAEAGGGSEAEAGDEGGTGASRLSTLLPLFRHAAQITIGVMAVMLVLSALGVNIGPLLAGAGVVGIAIGFGAQALVRDIVSGVFFLVDDAFRRGEYIDVGDVKGVVEKISIRSLRLRHHRGPLHTVPFGEIRHLTNYSRDWVIMKLEFRVTYDTDVRLVKKIFKQIGAELLEDPELGPGFIEPFKSQGVKEMQDSAMILRGKFMAKPGTQFMIRKEIYTRVQKAFKENGIEFAHRRVSVDLPPGVDPASPQGKAIADAAAAAELASDDPKPAAAE